MKLENSIQDNKTIQNLKFNSETKLVRGGPRQALILKAPGAPRPGGQAISSAQSLTPSSPCSSQPTCPSSFQFLPPSIYLSICMSGLSSVSRQIRPWFAPRQIILSAVPSPWSNSCISMSVPPPRTPASVPAHGGDGYPERELDTPVE